MFARSFQLPTAGVFQDLQLTIVYVPSDGRLPMISAAAPGFVGSLTGMNAHGFAMGVDTLRSAMVNTEEIGINSMLLVRHTVHNAQGTDAAIAVVGAAKRGCPYLFPMSDAAGMGAILEAGAYFDSNTVPDTTTYGAASHNCHAW